MNEIQTKSSFSIYDSLVDVCRPFSDRRVGILSLWNGRKKGLLDMIELYEKDLSQLAEHPFGFLNPDAPGDDNLGNGNYGIRYSSKKPEICICTIVRSFC